MEEDLIDVVQSFKDLAMTQIDEIEELVQGFLPQPGKDLERPSSTRLEARVPSHGSGAITRSTSPLAWRPDFPGAPREAH